MPMMADMQMQSRLTGKIAVQFETGELTQSGGRAHETRNIRDGVGLDLNEAQVMDIVRERFPWLDEKRISKVRYQKVDKFEGVAWLGQAELDRLNKRIGREEKKAAKEQKRAQKNAAAAAEVLETEREELAPEETLAPIAPVSAIHTEEIDGQTEKEGQQRSLFSAIGQFAHGMMERSIDKVFADAPQQETPEAIKAPKEIAEPAQEETAAPTETQTAPDLPQATDNAISAAAKPQKFDIDPDEMAPIKAAADAGAVNLPRKASSKAAWSARGEMLIDGLTAGEYQKQLRRELAQYEDELQAAAAKEEKKEEKAEAQAAAQPPQAKRAEPAACTFAFGVNKEFDALVNKMIDSALAGSTVTLTYEQLRNARADAAALQNFHITPDTPLRVRKPSLREIAAVHAQNNPPRKK